MKPAQLLKKAHRESGGFTLFEVLIALAIITVFLVVPVQIGTDVFRRIEEKDFFNHLHHDILEAQAFALSTKQVVSVKLSRTNRYYAVFVGTKEVKRRPFPESIEISYKTSLFEITFLANGNVSQFGTILFLVSNQEMDFKVHIGKGRVSYEYEGI